MGGDRPETVEFRELLALVWRGKWTVLGLGVIAAAIAALILSQTPNRFDARTEILIDPRDRRTVDFDQVIGDLPVDNAVVASEIAVLRSNRLLGDVVDALGLAADPEFGSASPGRLVRAETLARTWLPALADGPRLFAQTSPGDARLRAISALDRTLSASQKGRSYVIALTARSADPAKAAKIANTLASIYIEDQLASKYEATERASAFLSRRIADLKQRAEASDAAVEQYRADQSVGEARGQAVAEQQLAEINSQLVTARAARAEAEARHDQIRRRIDEQGETAAANLLSSPLILSLRQQRAEVKRREAELATRYGPKHPKMINVKAELGDIRSAISTELRKRVASLANDVEVALAREAALTAALTDVEDRNVDLSRASVGLRQLEREANANRRIYEDVLTRAKETAETGELQQADARIIARADPPLAPAAPRKTLIAGLAAIGGGLAGLGLVFLAELMANTFRTGSEAQRITGLPVLAKLPAVRAARRRGRVLDNLRSTPNSALAEAVRGLRNALVLANLDKPPKTVMITSAAPGEGKSTTSLALAYLSARMGKRAVVVECDLRRPSLAKALGGAADDDRDLVAALRGGIELEEALWPVGDDGAFALPVARPTPQAADILSSERFSDLVERLTRSFDLVVLDTPPALAVSDTAAVARVADAAVFLTRWDHTPRQAVTESLAKLEEAGAPAVGLALTMVDPKKEAAYEYGGYRAGAPDYSPYYA